MTPRYCFRPLPLLGNPHAQTLLAHVLPGPRAGFAAEVRSVALADGDQLALHDSIPSRWQRGDGVIVLVHGLGGSHRSGYMVRLGTRFHCAGLRVARMDLRGVGAGEGLARRTYHGGCSEDVRAVVADIHRQGPASPIVLIGMSLGGNLVLKLAAEAARTPVLGLQAVAAVAPPIDLTRCSAMLARWPFYDRYFARHLLIQVGRHQRHFPDGPCPRFPRRTTLRQFDDLWTAPGWGFADAADYYRQASAYPLLSDLAIPAFILTARDDPFIAVEPFESLRPRPGLEVHIAEQGGHLGFLGYSRGQGIRWAESQVVTWVLRQLRIHERATCLSHDGGK